VEIQARMGGRLSPQRFERVLKPNEWSIDHHSKVTFFGITSEVVVASRCQR
jgi:hypothetical protein